MTAGELDAETRDCVRDLCEAVAILGHGTVHMIGTHSAGLVLGKAQRLSERMDRLDELEVDVDLEKLWRVAHAAHDLVNRPLGALDVYDLQRALADAGMPVDDEWAQPNPYGDDDDG